MMRKHFGTFISRSTANLFLLLATSLAGAAATNSEPTTITPAVIAELSPAADQNHPPASLSGETKDQHDARMAWWRDARYGMFIHWGIYAVPAKGEWYMNKSKVPIDVYENYAKTFNPVKFNAEEWVNIAKDAGMKYIVLTAKHHDGFSMFDSKATDYNIVDGTPFKRDVVRELSAAARKAGIKFGIYYSHGQDWFHPGGGKAGGQWDPKQAGDEETFVNTIVIPQIHELLNNYGKIDLFWWDSSVNVWSQQHPGRAARLYEEFKPFHDLIINNRLYDADRPHQFEPSTWKSTGTQESFIRGDYATPEGFIPTSVPPGIDWETCDTISGYWGYNPGGERPKTSLGVLSNLLHAASKGGNYLLNVGPDAEGQISPTSVTPLSGAGAWLKANGESVYGTQAGPFPHLSWGYATRKGNRLYLHVITWPTDGKLHVPLKSCAKRAALLSEPLKELPIVRENECLVIQAPVNAPDNLVTVVTLDLEGEPLVLPVPSYHAKVSASSAEPGYGPEEAVDDTPGHCWRAKKTETSAWLEVDLSRPTTICGFDFKEPQAGFVVQNYTLAVQEGDQWKTIAQGSTQGGKGTQKTLRSVNGSKFRMILTNSKGGLGLSEFRLFRQD